jgi:hypothetical protein
MIGWSLNTVVALLTGLCVWLAVDWPFRDIAFYAIAGIVLVALPFTLQFRKGRVLAYAGHFAAALVCIAVVAVRLPDMSPLRTDVCGKSFKEISLVWVLQHLSQQQRQSPYWRFEVYDRDLAIRPVSLTIPDGSTLQEAINCVTRAAGCDYDWFWGKHDSASTRPDRAVFRVWKHGSKPLAEADYVLVQGSTVVWGKGHGPCVCPSGESKPCHS